MSYASESSRATGPNITLDANNQPEEAAWFDPAGERLTEMTAAPASGSLARPAARCHAIDWLRLIAILAVFLFHVAHIFDLAASANDLTHDPAPSVRNSESSVVLSGYAFFVYQWMMQLLFLLAGMTACYSLRSRGGSQYLRERVQRLLVPFLFGSLILIPWNGYVSALNHATFRGSFWNYFPTHFERTWEVLKTPQFHHSPIALYQASWHLWFLGFLLIFSFLALPLFLRGKTEERGPALTYLADLCERPWGLSVLGVPIMLIKLSLNAAFPLYLDWSDTLVFFVLFLYGWLFMTDIRFTQAIARQATGWLAAGCICFAGLLGTFDLGLLTQWLSRPEYTWGYSLYQILASVHTWAWVMAIMGFGLRSLNFRNAALDYANEAALPFYILHQPVILTVAFAVVQYRIGIGWKALIISVTALVITILLYEYAVRHTTVWRILFGMKPR
jgi:glucans biosynthesis protein C